MGRTVRAAMVGAVVSAAALGVVGIDVASGAARTTDRDLDLSEFGSSTTIDNPYSPFLPGTRWVYEGENEDGTERNVVEVTDRTKTILGVTCVVVHDVVYTDGELTEDTFDWYAQDDDGNVWYFGEATKELEAGEVVSTEGSWEAGQDGARPGIVMEAHPQRGDHYREEYRKGVAEDRARVLETDASITTTFGSFTHVVVTEERSRLEPRVVEKKYFAEGVGLVREETVRGGDDHTDLVEMSS